MDEPVESTRALFDRALGGDRGAFDSLLRRHMVGLRAFLRLRVDRELRVRESESDILQSICRDVVEDLGTFEWRGEKSFRAWLFQVALNKLREKRRFHGAGRRDRRLDGASDDLEQAYASVVSPSRLASANEQVERIENAFEQLPEEAREVITLSRLVGLSHAEIAHHLGRSEVAVRSLLSRSLVRLSEILAKSDRNDPASP